jgi:putative SOS response-associated peptidase YedK
MFWRFLPPFVIDPKKFRLDTINAKGETLVNSSMWRESFLYRRCLVPVDTFIEWQRIDSKTKLPWMFAMKDDKLFALGGVMASVVVARSQVTDGHVRHHYHGAE